MTPLATVHHRVVRGEQGGMKGSAMAPKIIAKTPEKPIR